MRGCAGALTAFVGEWLGDTPGAGEAVEGEQAAVVEQEEAIGDVAHARKLMRRNDRGRGGSLANEARMIPAVARAKPVVEEK